MESDPEWFASGRGIWIETSPGEGGPCPQPPEGEQIGTFNTVEQAYRAAACQNALRGVPSPVEAVERAVERLELIVAKCQEYADTPPPWPGVNEWIERQARAALSLLRPGEDGDA